MTQITIRRLDQAVIDGLKRRAAEAGRSMEEEARTILSKAVRDEQLARQRAWLKEMAEMRRRLFGDKIFPDSTPLIRKMRDERTRQNASWAASAKKK
jgi:plasmid stability protein